jgi:hypothetical protein
VAGIGFDHAAKPARKFRSNMNLAARCTFQVSGLAVLLNALPL